ncbi:MAG: fumarate hydratase C-terminal domain-containing protein, partial [Methanobacteriota archaeon]
KGSVSLLFQTLGESLMPIFRDLLKNHLIPLINRTQEWVEKMGGIRGIIGKGGMSATVRDQLRGRGVYFAFTGGCANLAAARMQLDGGFYEDLGMAEAVWHIRLDHLPLVVAMDSHGGDLFAEVERHAHEVFQRAYPTSTGTRR